MAAGERSEFGAAAERSPRPRSARAYSAPIGILGFSGIPFPFQKSHSRAEAGGRPFRARWDFGIFWNHIHIPKSHSVPFNPIQSHARPYGSRREALKQPEGGPSAAWLRCFGASAEALRCFGLGDYAAGGRPFSGLASVLRRFGGGPSVFWLRRLCGRREAHQRPTLTSRERPWSAREAAQPPAAAASIASSRAHQRPTLTSRERPWSAREAAQPPAAAAPITSSHPTRRVMASSSSRPHHKQPPHSSSHGLKQQPPTGEAAPQSATPTGGGSPRGGISLLPRG